MRLDELKATAITNAALEKEVRILTKKVEDEIGGYKMSLQRAVSSYEKELGARFQDYFKEKGFNVQNQGTGLRAYFQSCEIWFAVPNVIGGPTGQVPLVLEIKESNSAYKKNLQIIMTPKVVVDLSAKDRLKKTDKLENKKNVAEEALKQLEKDMQEPIELVVGSRIGTEFVQKRDLYELLSELEKNSMF